jgi:hypothetical protein
MNLNRWLNVAVMLGLILILSPLGAQADPYPRFESHQKYHRPQGKAYGWHGGRPHGYDRYQKQFRCSGGGPRNFHPYAHQVYAGPPPVAYVAPVAPIIGIQQIPQPQPIYSQPGPPGFHGQITF